MFYLHGAYISRGTLIRSQFLAFVLLIFPGIKVALELLNFIIGMFVSISKLYSLMVNT